MGSALRRVSPAAARWIAGYRSGAMELLPPRQIFALPPLHEKIKQQFPFRHGFFFEVGANDGLTQSNTAYLERYRGWRGILVEPLPSEFARCVANRPAAKSVNAALVADDTASKTVDIRYSNLMSAVDDPSRSLLSTHDLEIRASDTDNWSQVYAVPAMTVSRILDESGSPTVDFFSLDVEGYELEVLKGVDFSRHRPRCFLIEARAIKSIDSLLTAQGYRRIDQWSHHDYLYADANQR